MQAASSESSFVGWVRNHSLLLGILVGVGSGLLMLILMHYDLPLVESIMGRNIGWVRLAAYTLPLFVIVERNSRPHPRSLTFWALLGGLLLLHLVCFIWFILRIRPLGAIHYVVSGPIEVLVLLLLLKRGIRLSGPGNG